MKTTTKIFTLALVIAFTTNFAFANNLYYKLTAANLNYTSEKSLEFDIILSNTSPNEVGFKYSFGQYFFEFNPDIANGGILTYAIVSSELPDNMKPQNPSVSGNQLRLAVRPLNQNTGAFPEVNVKSPGLLIARMKLETSAEKFSNEPLNLKWSSAAEKFQTKICAFENDKYVEITNLENHVIDLGTESTLDQNTAADLPAEFSLLQNYPNPFNPETIIKFDIPEMTHVKLSVYDIAGREITLLVNRQIKSGKYEYKWNASQFASGIYFYKIESDKFSQIKRMILIK